MACGNLSFLNRDWTCALGRQAVRDWSPNHRTTREFLKLYYFWIFFFFLKSVYWLSLICMYSFSVLSSKSLSTLQIFQQKHSSSSCLYTNISDELNQETQISCSTIILTWNMGVLQTLLLICSIWCLNINLYRNLMLHTKQGLLM